MANKKQWEFLEDTPIRGLVKGGTYSFNPRVSPNGEVKGKILGDSSAQKVTFGYSSPADFKRNWKEV